MSDRLVTGKDVKRARLNAGLSYRSASAVIGVGPRTLSAFEEGKSIAPDTAKAIADWMGCQVTDLEQFARELEAVER